MYDYITNTYKSGRNIMKPRIFISSTFYDLKYIREDISNFVRAHDFEPIMFENGDIGYTPGKALDESCYETMKSADMVILIIGGNYGSPASGEKTDKFKEYLSVTRKEFSTAVNEGIPVYSFVESTVFAEYGVYDTNINRIEGQQIDLVFKATKNINVFRFIKEIYSLGKITVTEFKKPSEIKDFLSKQWADMFKNYLKLLKEKNDSKRIYDAIDNLQSIIKRMDITVNGLGKKIIGNEEVTYDKLRELQMREEAIEVAERICGSFAFKIKGNIRQNEAVEKIYKAIKNVLIFIEKQLKVKGVIEGQEIKDALGEFLSEENNISCVYVDIGFYIRPSNNKELLINKELDAEVLKILQSDFYSKKLIEKYEDE